MNNPPTVEDFRSSLIGGNFQDPPYTDEVVQQYLDMANNIHRCNPTAQIYLAAHFMTLDSNEGVDDGSTTETQGSGFAVRQKVGDLEAQYATPKNAEDAAYMTTPYGRRYLALKDAALKKFSARVR